MTVVWAILAGVGFFALIMASIALHEVGHLVPSKIFGVRVPKYFVVFGKTLWSTSKVYSHAYVFSLPPVRQENRAHDLNFPFSWRPLLGIWKWMNFTAGAFERRFQPVIAELVGG